GRVDEPPVADRGGEQLLVDLISVQFEHGVFLLVHPLRVAHVTGGTRCGRDRHCHTVWIAAIPLIFTSSTLVSAPLWSAILSRCSRWANLANTSVTPVRK